MFICEKCKRPFLMKDYLRDHICDMDKKEEKKDGVQSGPSEKTRKELIADAKEIGITGSDRMSKEDLIKIIEEAR